MTVQAMSDGARGLNPRWVPWVLALGVAVALALSP